jgi:hypothetical protein
VVRVFKARNEKRKAEEAQREQELIKELELQQKIRLEQLAQNRLFKQGNELFSADKWGTVLSGLKTYTEALREADKLKFKALSGESQQVNLENIKELIAESEKAIEQFSDYISNVFGDVSTQIVDAFQVMYEGGADAMESLEKSFSDMIESFAKDAINAAFIQPYLEQLNSMTLEMAKKYSEGRLTPQGLQREITNVFGDFYGKLASIQPLILDAIKSADEAAAAAGFESAFDSDDKDQDLYREKGLVGQIRESITEDTGTELVGRVNGILLYTQSLSNNSNDMLDYAVQNLTYMKLIKLNTDYLPEIAINTRRTVEKLEGL